MSGRPLELISFPMTRRALAEYGGTEQLEREVRALGCDGLELIWSGEELPRRLPCPGSLGYHLTFFPDWLDFYRGDETALLRKFGSREAWQTFYGGQDGRETLLRLYRQDLDRAEAAGARYVVFHVSDVSLEEGYRYRWLHRSQDVIDASAEILNQLLQGRKAGFALLLENQWWPGFTFTCPRLTARLLEKVEYENKGILLDTGHLLHTCLDLRGEREGVDYLRRRLREHGSLSRMIRGVHLHQSLSGDYVRRRAGALPPDWEQWDYLRRFGENYAHILRIDRHQPWTEPAIAGLLQEIGPEFLTHELSADSRCARARAVRRQKETLEKGGYGRDEAKQ